MSSEQLEKKRKLNERKKKTLEIIKVDGIDHENLDQGHTGMEKEKKNKLSLKKKRRRDKENEISASNEDQIHAAGSRPKSDHAKRLSRSQSSESGNSEQLNAASNRTKIETKKVKKESKHKKKDSKIAKERKIVQIVGDADEEKVEEIPLVDEDCSRGMKTGSRPKSDHAKRLSRSQSSESGNSEKLNAASNGTIIETKKVKKESKRKKDSKIAKERKIEQIVGDADEEKVEEIPLVDEDCSRGMKKKVKKESKHKKKDSKIAKERKIVQIVGDADEENVEEIPLVDEDCSRGMKTGSRPKSDHAKRLSRSQSSESGNSEKLNAASNGTKIKTKKVKKESKRKKDSKIAKERKIEQIVGDADEENVEEIPLVDEDCSRGMKKWLIKYKEDRPGLKVLQQRIDDFITAHEERQEQERKEREEQAAEGGWTVVMHHKGRKKTTDTETGVSIGSVSQAAVVDKMGKKKSKEAPIDFYRFQKREARRNEVMMLQSKFEQDKKRIQQLRAARKFRPY